MSKDKVNFYEVPIVEYLLSIGEPIESIGNNYYQHKQHDSLKINIRKNYFVWNSRSGENNSHGGIIQYLQIVHNLTLAEALCKAEKDLLGTDLKPFKPHTRKYPKAFNYSVKDVPVPIEAQRYLVAKRKIPNRIIKHFFSLGLITQNEENEIIFKWYKNDKIVGFTKQGTKKLSEETKNKYKYKRDYIKYVAPTTKENTYWGFNYLVGEPQNIFFFESPIDLISYYTIYEKELIENNNFWLISIDGVALEKIFSFLSYAVTNLNLENILQTLNICFDNDRTGKETFETLQKKNTLEELQKILIKDISFVEQIPLKEKDWNDFLKSKYQKKRRI